MTRASVSSVGFPSGRKALYIASRLMPAPRLPAPLRSMPDRRPRRRPQGIPSRPPQSSDARSDPRGVFQAPLLSSFAQLLGALDVAVLRALIATAEQHDRVRPAMDQINAVSGSIIDPQLRNTGPNGTHVARIASGEATDPDVDPSDGGAVAETCKPLSKRRCLPHLDHLCNTIHGRSYVENQGARARRPPRPRRCDDHRISGRGPPLRPARIRAVLGRRGRTRHALEPAYRNPAPGQDPRRRS